jgi:hypothetical protein
MGSLLNKGEALCTEIGEDPTVAKWCVARLLHVGALRVRYKPSLCCLCLVCCRQALSEHLGQLVLSQ